MIGLLKKKKEEPHANKITSSLTTHEHGVRVLEVRVGSDPLLVGIGMPRSTRSQTAVEGELGASGVKASVHKGSDNQEIDWRILYWRESLPKFVREKDLRDYAAFTASVTSGSAGAITGSAPISEPVTMDAGQYTARVDFSGIVTIEPKKKSLVRKNY